MIALLDHQGHKLLEFFHDKTPALLYHVVSVSSDMCLQEELGERRPCGTPKLKYKDILL